MVSLLFGLLNTSSVQNYVRDRIVEELENKIGTDLGIGHLYFHPFNGIELDSVYLYDQSGDKILAADKIVASVDLLPLLKKQLIINTAKLSDFDISLSKDSANSPLNIQYIIDAFKSDSNQSSDNKIQVKVSAVTLANGNFHYNVKDKPTSENFDANHISISNLNARLALKSLVPDSLNVQIKKLSLKEQSGLEISNLTSRLITQNKKASIRGFRLDLPNSFLQFDKCEIDLTNTDSSKNLLDYAVIDCIITPSYIAPKDVAAIVPALQYFTDLIKLEAHISGSIDNINVSDLAIDYGEKMHLTSNFEIKDIRDTKSLYLLGSIDNFTITGKEIEGLVNNFSKNKTLLPSQIKQLDTITFEGDVSGYLNQLTAFGSFETELGIIKTDILFGFNKSENIKSYLLGKIYTTDFRLGKLVQNDDFDRVTLDLNIKMEQSKYKKLKGNLASNIYNIDYKGYKYSDAKINIDYDGMRIDGQFDLNDENGVVNIDGLVDLSDKKSPEINLSANVKNLRFEELHLSDKMKQSSLSFALQANFKGLNFDDSEGFIKIDSIDFIRESKRFQMDNFLIETSGIADDRKLKIRSDILNGNIAGGYSFSTMIQSMQQTIHSYLPALINDLSENQKKNVDIKENNLSFNFRINNTEKLSNILQLPITIVSQSKIIGFYNNRSNKFKIELFSPGIIASGLNIKSGYVLIENPNGHINSNIDALITGKKGIKNTISINSIATDNKIDTQIAFSNDSRYKAKGDFSVSTLFTKTDNTPLLVDIDIMPSSLLLNGANWKMNKAHFSLQKDLIGINNFEVINEDGNQEIKIDGKYSPTDPQNILKTELKNIDLKYIFETLAIDVLRFGGKATGKVFTSSVEGKPYANTRLDVEDFQFNGTHLGHLNLFSELDEETKIVMMSGEVTSTEKKKTMVDGELDPINQRLSINFDADSLDISFLNTYTEKIFNNLSGRGTGKARLFGDFSDITVEGKAFIEKGKIGINFLKTDYSFSDSIYLKSNLIYFNNMTLTDQYNNTAITSGKVAHNTFKDAAYYIEVAAQNLLVYNASEKENPIFSGHVFGSGKGTISGDEQAVDIDLSLRTEDNTTARLNFMDKGVNEYNFVTYKHKIQEIDTISEGVSLAQPIQTNSSMDINLKIYIEATPAANVEIVMDPVGGDVLRGSGSGTLQFTWSNKSAPRIHGNYLINRGSYLFTFQKILERKFTLEDGSSVQFRGDPFEAELNVKATYKVIANLNDLSRSIVQTSGQTNIPVNCILYLSEKLKHPKVGLDLNFPTAVPEVERQIKVLLNTEEMINRQVAFLLLLSKFYTPSNSDSEYRTSDFASVASATLSSQLTKIISKIDSRWQLGTNIRTSDSEMTSTELELLLSSQLLDDRLLINGNFGYRDDPTTNTDAVIRDIDVEYLINRSGTWRVKAYNRYNEKFYYTGTSEQTQGVGIKYKRDFDKAYELLPWKPKKKPTEPQDTITMPIIPDSTRKGSSISSFIKIKE